MSDAVDRFRREAAEVVDKLLTALQSEPIPPIIYHYTNDVGLRGILKTGRIWLTDIFSLNDPSELTHGLRHAVQILKNEAAAGPPESRAFAEYMRTFVEEGGGVQTSAHYFMCSFSSSGDDLGQWRAYADNGRGYALGFDAGVLEQAFYKHGTGPAGRSFPIRYNDAELTQILRDIVERVFDLTFLTRGRSLPEIAVMDYTAKLATWLMVNFLDASLYFKHEAYNNEQEYRFLDIYPTQQKPLAETRVRHCSLIKYTEFDWRTHAPVSLKRIVIGPTADQEKAIEFAQACLREFDLETVEITCSKIPYRAG
jgi:hypothetical protein